MATVWREFIDADQRRCVETFMAWLERGNPSLEGISDEKVAELADAFSAGWILALGGEVPANERRSDVR